jgi:hypothetical protein
VSVTTFWFSPRPSLFEVPLEPALFELSELESLELSELELLDESLDELLSLFDSVFLDSVVFSAMYQSHQQVISIVFIIPTRERKAPSSIIDETASAHPVVRGPAEEGWS